MTSKLITNIITQKQIDNYRPTYLYIKQHSITGLLYFGKTIIDRVEKYKGSGVYWNRHIEKHGNNVETLWWCYFTDIYELVNFSMSFSEINDIVNSTNEFGKKKWANLLIETGLQGGSDGGEKHACAGKMSARGNDGKLIYLETDDPRVVSGELKPMFKGKVCVRDHTGKIYSVDKDDVRYTSGEFVGIAKGFTTVMDKDGNTFRVEKTDPRWISGELVGVAAGRKKPGEFTAKDRNGNFFRVTKKDPRWISGELVGIRTKL